MLDVFLCHAAADREIAACIAERFERCTGARVWLERCSTERGETIPDLWESGLSAAAILLLLSPDAVPTRLVRDDWEPVLQHIEGNAAPPIAPVLVRKCSYPRLLERRNFFQWTDAPLETLRALERWVMGLHQQDAHASFSPAVLPWFQGREPELNQLWEALVDQPGTVIVANPSPDSGKTCLAQEFTRRAAGHFRDVLWIAGGDRSPIFIAGELAGQLGIALEARPFDEILARLRNIINEHRLLLVLDDVSADAPPLRSPGGRASVLITTRSAPAGQQPETSVLEIESATCAGPDQPLSDPQELALAQAMFVCRRHDLRLDFAARIAELDESEARRVCGRLLEKRWMDPLDAEGKRFRLAGSPHLSGDLDLIRRQHAEVLSKAFAGWHTQAARANALLNEMEPGLEWAMTADWSIATELAHRAFAFLKTHGRLLEAAHVYQELLWSAQQRKDAAVEEECAWELSWLVDVGATSRAEPAGKQLALDL